MKYLILMVMTGLFFTSCKKDQPVIPAVPSLIFKFKFDSTQARLNNLGQPASTVAAGNAAQSPVFNKMSAHYVELAQADNTQLGNGSILYKATETTVGGATAIDFSKSFFAGNGETFLVIPLSSVTAGTYKHLRMSLAYQNYDVRYHADTTITYGPISQTYNDDYTGTLASFIGFNTYISDYLIKTQRDTVNANKLQGYWAFETSIVFSGITFPIKSTGQAPPGATTVVNPLSATSPIPAGSCVVTAAFNPGTLTITGTETKDIVIEVSLSTNKSFEWKEIVNNGKWDPLKNEKIVDMGIRGMIPTIK